MDSFADYLYYLLPSPLKQIGKKANHWHIFCAVLGRQFDELKKTILDVREQSMILTCPPVLLPVFGREREMPRFEGETEDAYRLRLAMKCIVARKAGTRDGLLLALAALGYEQSYLEPLYETDTRRWAEFILFLRGAKQSGVADLRAIDTEVMAVKQASSMPAYGMDAGNAVEITPGLTHGASHYPRCGEIVCGVFPRGTNVGYLLARDVRIGSAGEPGVVNYPTVGKVAASHKFYQAHAYAMYEGISARMEAEAIQDGGLFLYPVCSEKTITKGGLHHAENADADRH